MATVTLSVRLPEDVNAELHKILVEEKLIQLSEAARKLILIGLQRWKQEQALKGLTAGELTMLKAAKLAGMDIWSFTDLVKREKPEWVRLSAEDAKKDFNAA